MLSSIKHPRLSSAAIARAIQAIIDQLTETITERLFFFVTYGRSLPVQSTPFVRQASANWPPLLRKHSLWTGSLLAPRGLWHPLLSLGTYPPVATYKANAR
jgi:hypothetical protein